MITKDEIQAKYLALHDALGTQKDASDKELFDQQHAEIWRNCDIELQARKNELEAKVTRTPEEEKELVELESLFHKPTAPSRDYSKEIDDLKARIEKLEKDRDTIRG